MIVIQRVQTDKNEVESFRGFLPHSPAAMLLGKIVIQLEKQGHDALRERGANIEAVRYAQGFLDALGRFEAIAQSMLSFDLEKPEEEIVEDYEEEAVDVDF